MSPSSAPGAMGIALAVRLAGRSGRVLLVEAGDEHFRPADNLTFFKAESVDHPRHSPTELYRRRMLGEQPRCGEGVAFRSTGRISRRRRSARVGRSNSRKSTPMFPMRWSSRTPASPNFPQRPHSRALASRWETPRPVKTLDRIERYSKPKNVWRKWREFLARSPDVTVLSETVCTGVLDDATAGRVRRSRCQDSHRSPPQDHARKSSYWRAAVSKRRACFWRLGRPARADSGKDRDLVGRYYMCHLVSSAENVGTLKFCRA